MRATNKGKQYIKHGEETPESLKAARAFMNWYGQNVDYLRGRIARDQYDDEVATDTALNIYDAIARKGRVIEDYIGYFLRAYHTNRRASLKRPKVEVRSLSDAATRISFGDLVGDGDALGNTIEGTIAAPEFDSEAYELECDALVSDILQYVRDNYAPYVSSIFEIYVSLWPEMSYTQLAAMLGWGKARVSYVLIAVRKDLAVIFAERKDFLLSII